MLWIDAPEMKQKFGPESQVYLSNLILDKKVKVVYGKKDLYQRPVGIIMIGDVNINKKMVEDGYAWSYKNYSTSEVDLLQENAQKNNVGIWKDVDPACQPWNFRKKKCE